MAGRLVSATDGNGTSYVSNADYNADNSPKIALLGHSATFAGITSSFLYNPRLQLCRITAWTSGFVPSACDDPSIHGNLMDRGYNFNFGSADNGNVMSITNYRDTSRSQAFTYDALNRLTAGWTTANTGAYSWGENYSIDAWANLQISSMSGKVHGGNFQCAGDQQNHATCLGYDAAENVTANGPASYIYDQENRIASTAGMTYVYDANGNRVEKLTPPPPATPTDGTIYWYGTPGIIAESDLSGTLKSEYVFFNGKRVARIDSPGGSVHYYLSDHLNSTSLVVSSTGITEEESDYSPFGTEYPVTGIGANHYKFTGKERDSESGLEYFGARYYSNGFGRFLGPDKPFEDQHSKDPQSWNLYLYTLNNPIKYFDDTGEATRPAQSASINRALATDPTLRGVIIASNNFSPGAFEDAFKSGGLSNLNTGAGNTLRGLAGEATVIDDINHNMTNLDRAFPSPTSLSGVNPDVGVLMQTQNLLTATNAILLDSVGPSGAISNENLGPAVYMNFMEVKSGLSASSIERGVDQAITTASAIEKAGLSSVAISTLVVDLGAWARLPPERRIDLARKAAAGGAHIQVQSGLADAARRRAQRVVEEAEKKQNEQN